MRGFGALFARLGAAHGFSRTGPGARADRVWLLLAPSDLEDWASAAVARAADLHAVARAGWGQSAVIVAGGPPLSADRERALAELASALRPCDWGVHLAG